MTGVKKSFLLTLLIFQFMTTFLIKCDLNPENVVVAINCGGEAYKDSKGVIYDKVI